MKTINPKKFSKSKTDFAGKILCSNKESNENKNHSLMILSNWRASHSYPMHIFKKKFKESF